uniref:(northern house mosquito) hypothetical protein n=1 Tax=Culex pipiens TaxID=7175 RepID=A0A8D8B4G5_CULPI
MDFIYSNRTRQPGCVSNALYEQKSKISDELLHQAAGDSRSQRRSAERADGHRAADYHLVAGRERGLQGDTVHPGVGHVRVHLCPGGAQYRSLRCDYPSDELFRMLEESSKTGGGCLGF